MSTNLVILGRPPRKDLLNVKSRTLRVLTIVFVDEDSMLPPWQFLSFFLWSKKQEPTPFPNQDNELA